MTPDLPDHVRRNRAAWNAWAADYATWAPKHWRDGDVSWGMFSLPDADLGALPADIEGMDAVELGCGTAYFSSWLARRGARPVGIDNSPAQLETARRLQAEFGIDFPLHLGNAEALPFPDASFDLAVSEYGASIWCDPYRWVPEAARVLRRGGHLAFLRNSTLMLLCTPVDATDDVAAGECLVRPLFGLHRVEWPDTEAVEFHLSHGDWVRLLRANGFTIENLIEIQAPEQPPREHKYVTLEWARQWPCEEIWVARKA